jgi:hypothetical protein
MAGDVGTLQQRDREVEREIFREIARDRSSEGSAPLREVKDSSGIRWRVTEVSGQQVPGARGDACLVFESDTAIRRVWHYPSSWRDLPAPDLIAVSWGR